MDHTLPHRHVRPPLAPRFADDPRELRPGTVDEPFDYRAIDAGRVGIVYVVHLELR